MKKLFLLTFLLVSFSALSSAQTLVSRVTDSSGTATVYWQKVSIFQSLEGQNVDIMDDGSVNIKVALTPDDTLASRTRYQRTIKPGEGLAVFTNQQYIFIKCVSGTCSYRVGGEL